MTMISDSIMDLSASEKMKECLEIRLALLFTDYSKKNEFEKNELEILKMETERKIEKLNNLIIQRNMDFQADYEEYIRSLEFDK
jgi:hypothetical protein